MNITIFILTSGLIVYILYTVIKDTVGDIKVLSTGSTLEKMQLLSIGVPMTTMRKSFKRKVNRHKRVGYLTVILGWGILLFVIGIVIFRLFELQMGI